MQCSSTTFLNVRNWQKAIKKLVGIFSLFFIVAIITCYAMHGHGILYSTGIDRTCLFSALSLLCWKIITITYTNRSKLVKSVDLPPPVHTVIIMAWLDYDTKSYSIARLKIFTAAVKCIVITVAVLLYKSSHPETYFYSLWKRKSGFYIFMFLFFRCRRAAEPWIAAPKIFSISLASTFYITIWYCVLCVAMCVYFVGILTMLLAEKNPFSMCIIKIS